MRPPHSSVTDCRLMLAISHSSVTDCRLMLDDSLVTSGRAPPYRPREGSADRTRRRESGRAAAPRPPPRTARPRPAGYAFSAFRRDNIRTFVSVSSHCPAGHAFSAFRRILASPHIRKLHFSPSLHPLRRRTCRTSQHPTPAPNTPAGRADSDAHPLLERLPCF